MKDHTNKPEKLYHGSELLVEGYLQPKLEKKTLDHVSEKN